MKTKPKKYPQSSFRLTDKDIELIEWIRENQDLDNKTDAIRLALKYFKKLKEK